jgi:amino acid adenylation domain-containing protein
VLRNSLEEQLAEIWQEVLGIERVGFHDNFFEIAGESLAAIQLVSRVRDVTQSEFSLLDFVQRPTIAGMVLTITQHVGDKPAGQNLISTIVPDCEKLHLPFPLTDIQQAYWVGRNAFYGLGKVACHSYTEIQFAHLDLERLNHAWQHIIKRHDMLRAIVLPDGQQQILDNVPPYNIKVLDLRGKKPEAVEVELEVVHQRMSHQVLPSDRWPLYEIRASRLGDHAYRLHVSLDLLIADAWSFDIINRELSQLYENPDTILPPLELSFRDCVLAEIKLQNLEQYRSALEYWRNRLETLPPAPELPLAKEPGNLTELRFARLSSRLEPEIWLKLKKRAAAAGITPSGALYSAFADVLKVWSKSPTFTLNLALFNRLPLHPQVNDIIGDFTSSILLEVNDSSESTFEVRTKRLQEQLWKDFDHRYVSGVRIMRELTKLRGGESRPVMPVVFTSSVAQGKLGRDMFNLGGRGETVYNITQTPQVWIDHQVFEEAGALVFSWDYVEGLFPEGLLPDMFEGYCSLLQSLATDGESWQETWPETARKLVPHAQLEQRAAVNDTGGPVPAGMLHTLFAEQVSQRPGQPAVIASNRSLTYEELYRHSNQLGHHLRRLGARPNTLVAVVMEKGWEQVVAVMAVLVSGAAYLPIDPKLPGERLRYLLENGQVKLILTHSGLDKTLEWNEGHRRICVDSEELPAADGSPLDSVQGPEDLAYVIYTSGSTGLPKGVMIDHRGAVNTIVDINRRFGVRPDDRVLALSALSFDLSVYDIFGTLAAGGTIIMPGPSDTRDPSRWAQLIARNKVTIWNSVPALMEMFVEYMADRSGVKPGSLRLALLSGDWLPVSLPDRIRKLVKGIQVISLGGATEASIWSILYPIETVDAAWKSIPYGKPMVNQEFHVLNDALEPCPVWVPGQLYIGGIGLAKGYWRDDEKTRASFIVHPRTGERLYQTGDTGRYMPDGNIEYLGREDYQVKIQGFRVELGEIETALAQHPKVRAAVVAAAGEQQGNKRLVAYVVPKHEQLSILNVPPELKKQRQGEAVHNKNPALSNPIERLEFIRRQPGLRQEMNKHYVQLPKHESDETVMEKYAERRSYRKFQQQPIPLEQFSRLLSCLRQIEFEGLLLPKYRYASAGSLYPVQTYLHIMPDRVEGVPPGIYYYHPGEHRLVMLSASTHLDRNIHAPANRSIFDESAFTLFLIGQLNALTPLYGEAGTHYAVLEAGAMCQLLEMTAPACHIGLCQTGNLNFEQIRHLFMLDESHVFLHCLLGGQIDAGDTTFQSLLSDSREYFSLLQQLGEDAAREEPSDVVDTASSTLSIVSPPQINGFLADELQLFLREKLPEYMVPSAFVILDNLPMTPNGKVDRKALLELDIVRSTPDSEETDDHHLSWKSNIQPDYVAPSDELERVLTDLWQDLLGIERVGIHDNFFQLGGNSLLAVRLFLQIEKRLGKNLPLATLFEAPNIERLASILRSTESLAPWPSLVALQPNGSKEPFFCVHAIDGDVMPFSDLAQNLGPEQPFYGLRAQGLDGRNPPYNKVEDMAAHYIKEIRALKPSGPYLLGGMCFGGIVAYEMAQQLRAQGQEVALLALIDTPCPPFDSSDYMRYRIYYHVLPVLILRWFVRFFTRFLPQLWQHRRVNLMTYTTRRIKDLYRNFLNIIPLGVRPEDVYQKRINKATDQALRSYTPQPYPGRVVHIMANDPRISASEDVRLRWGELAESGIEVTVLPMEQPDMLREPHVGLLAEKLTAYIEKVQFIEV